MVAPSIDDCANNRSLDSAVRSIDSADRSIARNIYDLSYIDLSYIRVTVFQVLFLKKTESIKDLVVTSDNKLKFDEHINNKIDTSDFFRCKNAFYMFEHPHIRVMLSLSYMITVPVL